MAQTFFERRCGWFRTMALTTLFCSLFIINLWAQAPPQPPSDPQEKVAGEDENPTKVILWSLRNEYYNVPGEPWLNMFILRSDKAILRNKPQLPGRRGLLLRMDIPFTTVHQGAVTRAGLGNIYVQAASIVQLTRKFGFAAGSGLTMPTNTDNRLGVDKWVAAPIAVPIWFTRRKGFFLIKAQGFLSFAGDENAASVRLLKIQPVYMIPLTRRWWMHVDTESTTNFGNDGHTGFTTGLRVGKLVSRHLAMWVEPRVGWGRYRDSDFGLKSSLYWVR